MGEKVKDKELNGVHVDIMVRKDNTYVHSNIEESLEHSWGQNNNTNGVILLG